MVGGLVKWTLKMRKGDGGRGHFEENRLSQIRVA
jgi:hypothetical protein